jgi:hypothetical protein
MTTEPSDAERVGAFAARVLEDLYAVVYGERPVGVRSWSEGGALLTLLRLAGPAPFGGYQPDQPEQPGMLPYAAIPELVAAAVRAQTGCELEVGGWSVEAELGLVMFVFRLPGQSGEQIGQQDGAAGLSAVSGPAEWPRELTREHLRLVEDDREPGPVSR